MNTGAGSIGAFLAFCEQRNPRFIHPIPLRTSYEQMLDDLARGDAAVRAAFDWARNSTGSTEEAVLDEWRRCAEIERANVRRVVRVRHRFAPAPAPARLQELRTRLNGASPELAEFYARHDGASLFIDAEDEGSGLFFFPIEEMPAELREVTERLDFPALETVEDGRLQVFGRPPWLERAVVFAGFGYAPERLLLPTEGEHRGSVFLFTHDPLQLQRLSPSFGGFLEQLRYRPTELLGRFGGNSYEGALGYESDELRFAPQ